MRTEYRVKKGRNSLILSPFERDDIRGVCRLTLRASALLWRRDILDRRCRKHGGSGNRCGSTSTTETCATPSIARWNYSDNRYSRPLLVLSNCRTSFTVKPASQLPAPRFIISAVVSPALQGPKYYLLIVVLGIRVDIFAVVKKVLHIVTVVGIPLRSRLL